MSHGPCGLDGGTLPAAMTCLAIISVATGSASANAGVITKRILVFIVILLRRVHCAGLTTSGRNNFNCADLRVLDLGSEGHLNLAIGHFNGDRLHVSLQRPTCLEGLRGDGPR